MNRKHIAVGCLLTVTVASAVFVGYSFWAQPQADIRVSAGIVHLNETNSGYDYNGTINFEGGVYEQHEGQGFRKVKIAFFDSDKELITIHCLRDIVIRDFTSPMFRYGSELDTRPVYIKWRFGQNNFSRDVSYVITEENYGNVNNIRSPQFGELECDEYLAHITMGY